MITENKKIIVLEFIITKYLKMWSFYIIHSTYIILSIQLLHIFIHNRYLKLQQKNITLLLHFVFVIFSKQFLVLIFYNIFLHKRNKIKSILYSPLAINSL